MRYETFLHNRVKLYNEGWSDPVTTVAKQDLSIEGINMFSLEEYIAKRKKEDRLDEYDLNHHGANQGKITRAALVLLGRDEAQHFIPFY